MHLSRGLRRVPQGEVKETVGLEVGLDAMPTGAGKQDEDHDHWQAREAVWASWGDQEAYGKKMAETKDRRDAARTVHEAKQKKKQEELEAASSTSHVTERQEKVSERNVRNCDWFVAVGMIRRHTLPPHIGCGCVRNRLPFPLSLKLTPSSHLSH